MKNIKIITCLLFVSAFAKAQQLQSYIEEAQSNNPEIQAFELRYNIAEEKVNEADCCLGLALLPRGKIMRVQWQTHNMWILLLRNEG